jgi:DNA-binding NarL/FixJ family response regulator
LQMPIRLHRPTTQPANGIGPKHARFVRVFCPYPLVAAGLGRALEEAGVRHGTKLPAQDIPYRAVVWADKQEDIPGDVRRVREENPAATVLVLGLRNDPSLALAALRAGARGFLHAGMTSGQIARALEVVDKGEVAAPRGLLEFLLEDGDASADPEALSARQREILKLVDDGLTNAQIAGRLFLTESTIKQHLRAAYKLLGVQNRTEAAGIARRATGVDRYRWRPREAAE